MHDRLLAALAVLALAGAGCEDAAGPGGGGNTYNVVTRFEGQSPVASTAAAAAAHRGYTIPANGVEDEACGAGRIVCLTPDNLAGRIYAGGLTVGGFRRDGPGVVLTTIGASQAVRERPDTGKTGTLTFDIAATTDFSGSYTCCGGPLGYPTGEDAVISRIELNFDYLDMEFTVPHEAGTSLAGETLVIRQVYVDGTTAADVNGEMQLGDKLVRRAGESSFRWCGPDDHDACTGTARPSEPLQAPNIYLEPEMEGNPSYATFAIPLANGEYPSFTQEEAERGNWLFHVAFDLTDGAVFEMSDWSEMDSEYSIVRAFYLLHNVGDAHTSVRVRLTKEALPGA